ncbi:hypothetical protein AVEN_162838-1 [Araneus ventricosus]|uniref:Uncharacterized protein n=1 Tax=Araneus ventricosus TaxID=182803 RepID=A0A4Y2C716_ARAVE|nr:hypothetical protein AVEN_162838-1 [Araneus ventricosus]
MPTPYELEIEYLRKFLAEVETDEDSDFDNGPEDVLEENFSDHESFGKHNMEKDGYSGNEANNLEWFTSNDSVQRKKEYLYLFS